MIIDAHTHMMNDRFFEKLAATAGAWSQERVQKNGIDYVKRKANFANVKLRLEGLDRNNYDMQVVCPQRTFDSNYCPGDISVKLRYARVLNDSMADLTEQSKGRLIAVGSVPMTGFDQGSRQEMERAIKIGIKAVTVSSNIKGKPIDSPEFEAFWATAAEFDLPVYIHPVNPMNSSGRPYEDEYDLLHWIGWPYDTELMLARLVFSGYLDRYPSLKVVSHHLGGGLPFFLGRAIETYDPTTLEKGSSLKLSKPIAEYFSKFYYDTAVGGSAPAIECTCKAVGISQVIFATDAPFGPGTGEGRLESYPKVLKSIGLPKADEDKVFSGNIKRVLKIK